jgi:hypothetical protein
MGSSVNKRTLVCVVGAASLLVGVGFLVHTFQRANDAQPRPALTEPPAVTRTIQQTRSQVPDLAGAAARVPLALAPHTAVLGGSNGSLSANGQPRAEVAVSLASADPHLAGWLAQRKQNAAAGNAVSLAELSQLQSILKESNLTPVKLIELGKSVTLYSDDVTTAMFYAEAIERGHYYLPSFDLGGDEAAAKLMLRALNSTKPLLWKVVDSGDRRFIPALTTLNADLVKYIAPGESDSYLKNARAHGFIGSAECLYLTGTPEAAAAAALAIDTTGMNQEQRTGVAWIRAMALVQAHREAEAIADLRFVLNSSDTPKDRRPQGCRLLFNALCHLHRGSEAQAVFDEYRQHYAIDESGLAAMSAMLEDAKFNEAWDKAHGAKGEGVKGEGA